MNRLMDHLPPYYQKIKEFQELTETGSTQLNHLSEDVEQVLNDQFVQTASEQSTLRREKMFRIVPDPTKETLGFRKKRVLSRMQNKPPYVEEYLRDLLDSLLGENSHKLNLDIDNFYLETILMLENVQSEVGQELLYKEVSNLLEKIVPLNMDIGMTAQRELELNLFTAGIISEWKQITLNPIEFTMPNINVTQHVAGYVSTWNQSTIQMEVNANG